MVKNSLKSVKNYTYNDGFIYFGKINIERNSKKEKTGEKFKVEGKRPFAFVYIRDTDNDIAYSSGYKIDKKIRIPYSKLPEQNIKIKINNEDTLYEVKRRDEDDKYNIYLYLQKTDGGKNNG